MTLQPQSDPLPDLEAIRARRNKITSLIIRFMADIETLVSLPADIDTLLAEVSRLGEQLRQAHEVIDGWATAHVGLQNDNAHLTERVRELEHSLATWAELGKPMHEAA